MKGIRVIVCGGRDFADWRFVETTLGKLHAERPIRHLFHGNARGADSLAATWAKLHRDVSCHACPANWARDGKAAGLIRNKQMLGFKPDLVVAFPGGKGTAHMVKIAKAAGVEVLEVQP